MSLIKQINYKGIDVPEAYHKIGIVEYNNSQNSAVVTVLTYANQNAKEGKVPFFESSQYIIDNMTFEEVDTNIIKKSYEYLKNLTEYQGADDI